MGTVNRIKDVFVRLKLRRKSYFRRASLVTLLSFLLVSYQNCSQGKFEIDEGQMSAASKGVADVSGSGGGSNGSGGGSTGNIPTPPPTEPDLGTATATPEQIAAEKARRQRCASAVKNPVFTNSADFSNKVVNLKSGLGTASGDVQANNAYTVTVDSSRGIDTSKHQALDACQFRTYVLVEPVNNDASRSAVFEHGIGTLGQLLSVDANTTAVGLLNNNTLQIRTNNNNDNEADFGPSLLTVSAGFQLRQGQNGNERSTRCVQGNVYYRVKIVTETNGLTDPKPPMPLAQITVNNVRMESSAQYVKVEIENACWKEYNLAKIMGAASEASIPAANAHLGTAVAIDGDWAVAISDTETNGTANKGYVYIFRKVSGAWTFFQKFNAPNGNGTSLTGVALKDDVLVVASAGDGLGYPGRVFVYNLDGNTLSAPLQTIANPVSSGTKFGSGVAVAGNSIAIGDSYLNGKAYLFKLNSGLYGEGATANRAPSATLNAADISATIVGLGANVVYQGSRLLVAAYNGNEGYKGSVHVYDVAGGSFGSPIHKYAPATITTKGNFGFSIAFDGTALAVGAYENETSGNAAGAIVYYKNYSSADAPKTIQGNTAEERFGVTMAFAGDSLYVGARGGTGSSGTINRYKKDGLDATAASAYNSRSFVQRSHDAKLGEGFSYSMGILSGASVPTVLVSSQTKDYVISSGNSRSKAGGLYLYEVK
ncbi:MAG: hypothetical protein JNL11_16305 [Bdellovibrionaceae bacterium]|nr:hypothetical protein [Pseudobdellovibrionaceae bacterium]